MDDVDVTIIGAGVVGLAIAASITRHERTVAIIEKNPKEGQETSSRNSEVIHSGIYYPPGTLKATLCVKGNKMLYEYCEKKNILHSCTGKIVVASNHDETEYLKNLKKNGETNGVNGLSLMSREEIRSLEPNIACETGLLVPSTGIIDSHMLMSCLLSDTREQGGYPLFCSEVTGIRKVSNGFSLRINDEYEFTSRVVVNSAGLQSDKVAVLAGIDINKARYRLHYCKGQYFRSSKKFGVKRLIYPVPAKNIQSLGIHLVLELGGGIRFGPDAIYVDRLDYAVDEERREAFYDSVRRYLPSITPDDLSPDTSGIRPKLQEDGGPFRDFVVNNESNLHLDGLINLIGIDSPGLTSALAIGEYVDDLINRIKKKGES